MRYDCAVVPCVSYDEETVTKAIYEAVENTVGFGFAVPGKKIAIKANLLLLKKPEAAATTHPIMLYCLSKILTEKGCSVVIGDSPGGLYTYPYVAAIYKGTGIDLAEKGGAELNRDMRVSHSGFDGKVVKELNYTGYLDDADYIIDFAKLKTHGMLLMTGATKNMFGIIPGVEKPEYHYKYPRTEDFADMLVDITIFKKPVLSLIDACMAMEGNGPSGGKPRHVGALIASSSPYYADVEGARIMGLDPMAIPYLKAAYDRGLMPQYPDSINLYGSTEPYSAGSFELIDRVNTHFDIGIASAVFERKPVLKKDLCIRCGECERICPKKAIKLAPYPEIDRKACIRCFCCQEFCPRSALIAKRPLIARIINGRI